MTMVLRAFFDRVIRTGMVTVKTVSGSFQVGDGTGNPICIRLHDRRANFQLVTDPSSALGDLYMDGRLTVEEASSTTFWLSHGRNLSDKPNRQVQPGMGRSTTRHALSEPVQRPAASQEKCRPPL